MRAVVTGVAGFIGSHLAERLVADGWRVVGVDAFTEYYDRADKEANITRLGDASRFSLIEGDVANIDLRPVLHGADAVFHLAAQPGVRASFGDGFADYLAHNLLALQRVFEAALLAGTRRVVWASSSSVYGDAETYPCVEGDTPLLPRSPYGATKRAGEDLARIYAGLGLASVGLRYFTVYGPRQRPDMAMRRLCEAAVHGTSFPLHGDGLQSRDFTFVADAVDATVRAATAHEVPLVLNVGGGQEATMRDVIATVRALAGRDVVVDRRADQHGDVRRTAADTTLARRVLGWAPHTALEDGLRQELNWVAQRAGSIVEAGAAS